MKSSLQISLLALCLVLIMAIGQANSTTKSRIWGSVENCQKYDKNGKCIQCIDRYWLDSSACKCLKVSDYCLTWNPNTGLCTTCYLGYGSPRNGICGATPECEATNLYDQNCQCYSDDRLCVKCYSGYKLDENRFCVSCGNGEENQSDHCVKYWYGDSKGKWYNNWFSGCKAICKKCEDGYYLDKNYICHKLPENCKEVDEKGKCICCEEGYRFDWDKNCVQLVTQSEDKHCKSYKYVNSRGKWYTSWVSGCNKACVECCEGYFLDSSYQCVELPPYCVKAQEDGCCTKCVEGYKLNSEGQCICATTENKNHCLKYCYLSKDGKTFPKWYNDCQRVCAICQDGYYLNCKRQCVELPTGCVKAYENGTCLKCCKQYAFSLKGECFPVVRGEIENCAVYKYVDTKGQWYSKWVTGCKKVCVECKKNYELDKNGDCVPKLVFDPLCVRLNQNGTCDICAFRSVRDKHGTCKKVSDQCREWDGKGLCIACYLGYKLCDGECLIA